MAIRPRSLFLATAFAVSLLFPAAAARAEDAAEPPKKAETDDTSIFKDWKLVKARGIRHARTRAEFWAGKGVEGKDLFFLGLMWNRGEDYGKAIETLEKFLEWAPPSDDQKAVDANKTNREFTRRELISAYMKNKDYGKAVAAAQKFREEFSGSAAAPESWGDQGRAHRLAGERDRAIEAWNQAIGLKYLASLFDLADLYLCDGEVDKAKEVLDKYPKEDLKGRDTMFNLYRQFLDVVGTAAPSLEAAANVGSGDPPKDWSKPTLLMNWAMTTPNADRRLKRIEEVRRAFSDKMNAAGVATYNQYNPQTMKVEKDMTPEAEQDWYKKLIADSPILNALPPMIVVPKEVMEALKLRYEGQMVVVDGEGKLRYIRITDTSLYDTQCVEFLIKKLSGS
jgi:tetratricopeptide (TPR) repeat protein